MNSSVQCVYLDNKTNITATLLGKALENPENITGITTYVSSLIDQCPQVCDVVFGNGNPDISGIGVFVSFVLQGIYFIVFGPCLSTLLLLMPKKKVEHHNKQLKRFKKLFDAINATSIFFTFSTLIAAVVRLRQLPGEYESIFLYRLSRYLGAVSRAVWPVYMGFWLSLEGSFFAFFRPEELYIMFSLMNEVLAGYVNTATAKQEKNIQNMLIKLVTVYCTQQLHYPSSTKTVVNPSWKVSTVLLAVVFLVVPVLVFVDYTNLLLRKIFAFVRLAFQLQWISAIRRMVYSRTFWTIVFVFYNLMTMVNLIGNIVFLWDIRANMLALSPAVDEDNLWGFGQITAVLLWLPTTLWMIRNFVRLLPGYSIIAWFARKFCKSDEPPMVPIMFAIIGALVEVSLDQSDPCAENDFDKHEKKPLLPKKDDEEHAPRAITNTPPRLDEGGNNGDVEMREKNNPDCENNADGVTVSTSSETSNAESPRHTPNSDADSRPSKSLRRVVSCPTMRI